MVTVATATRVTHVVPNVASARRPLSSGRARVERAPRRTFATVPFATPPSRVTKTKMALVAAVLGALPGAGTRSHAHPYELSTRAAAPLRAVAVWLTILPGFASARKQEGCSPPLPCLVEANAPHRTTLRRLSPSGCPAVLVRVAAALVTRRSSSRQTFHVASSGVPSATPPSAPYVCVRPIHRLLGKGVAADGLRANAGAAGPHRNIRSLKNARACNIPLVRCHELSNSLHRTHFGHS